MKWYVWIILYIIFFVLSSALAALIPITEIVLRAAILISMYVLVIHLTVISLKKEINSSYYKKSSRKYKNLFDWLSNNTNSVWTELDVWFDGKGWRKSTIENIDSVREVLRIQKRNHLKNLKLVLISEEKSSSHIGILTGSIITIFSTMLFWYLKEKLGEIIDDARYFVDPEFDFFVHSFGYTILLIIVIFFLAVINYKQSYRRTLLIKMIEEIQKENDL